MRNAFKEIGEIYKKLAYILTADQKKYGLLVVLFSFLTAGFELVGVSVIIPLVDALIEPMKLLDSKYLSPLFGFFSVTTETQIIVSVIVCVITIYIIKNLFFCFNAWLRLKYSCKIQRECSIRMFSSYLNRGYSFFLDHNENELLQGAIGDISGLYVMIIDILQVFTQVTMIALIIVFMLYSDWKLALGIIVAAILCLAVITKLLRKRMSEAGLRIREYSIRVNKTLLEAFHGIKEVLVMQRRGYYIDEYEDVIKRKQKYQIVQGVGAETPAYFIEAICITGIMSVLCARIIGMGDREGFVATLAAFAVGAFRILPGLGKISSALNGIVSYIPNLNAIYDNIQMSSEQERKNELITNTGSFDAGRLNDFRTLSIQNISFNYDADESRKVLDNVSLEINRGESIAFIGETGAGKSTLADIILGLLEPTNGCVKVDDVDIRAIPGLWARLVAFVPQSIYLSDRSVRNNVAFGVDDKDIDDEVVKKALAEADILSFVESMPNGIDTEIGERGVRLSGGQCQRLGIARALYRNPQILILDEATSALDNDTERIVMDAIEQLHGKMTLIIIAHRLTTIRECDVIYEIANGKVLRKNKEDIFS